MTKRPMTATPSGGVVTSSTPLSATAQRRRSQLALAKSAREASREKETLRARCEHLETHIETLREDASTGAEMGMLTSDLESEIRRLELEHERAAENDEWLRRALQEKASTVAAMERERGTLVAKVAELEDTVAEGEACLRDAEAQRDKMARRCKRVQAGRLAAEATAAALTGEVSRLHAALERMTNGGESETNAASTVLRHGKVTVECVRSPYASGVATGLDFDDLADSDSELDEDESRCTNPPPVPKTTPGAALRELSLGDSAMDAGSPSADSNGSVVSKHPNAEASNNNQFEFRVEYTPESKPGKLTHRMFTPSKTDIEVVDALAGFVGDCVSAATVDGELVTFAVLAMRAASSMRSPVLKFLYGVAVVGAVLLAMIVTWELVGAASGESPVKGIPIRMGGVPPRVRPSWREGFILV